MCSTCDRHNFRASTFLFSTLLRLKVSWHLKRILPIYINPAFVFSISVSSQTSVNDSNCLFSFVCLSFYHSVDNVSIQDIRFTCVVSWSKTQLVAVEARLCEVCFSFVCRFFCLIIFNFSLRATSCPERLDSYQYARSDQTSNYILAFQHYTNIKDDTHEIFAPNGFHVWPRKTTRMTSKLGILQLHYF